MIYTSQWNLITSFVYNLCMHGLLNALTKTILGIYFKTHMELNSIMKCWHPYDQNNMS